MKKKLIIVFAICLSGLATCFNGAFGAPAAAQGAAVATAFSEAFTESDAPAVVASPAGQWNPVPMKSMSGGAVLFTDKPGSALDFEFTGAAVAADMILSRGSGTLGVTVDGKPFPAVDLYRTIIEQKPVRLVLANNLTPGKHKVRLEVLPASNPKSLGKLVDIDTLRVANMPYGSISGVLECSYNEGMPVMRADVSATADNGELRPAVTDADGKYITDALAPGTYSLRFEHPGYDVKVQPDVAVATGQQVALPKILLEEHTGARPLTFIRYPLGVRPVIVRPGDEFEMEVAAPQQSSGWQASIESPFKSAPLALKNAEFDAAKGRWTLTLASPAEMPSLLFGIRLKFSGGVDFQPRAVMLVPAFKDSIRVVHLTDVHVYKSAQLFDRYKRMTEEVNLINPDVVVVTGDLTDTNGYTDERWPESDQYPPMLDVWNSFNVPTFIVSGNHDLSPNNKEDDHQRWNKFFDVAEYSFNVGSYHFTAIDDSFVMASGPEKKFYREDIFPGQLEWLEKDLAANSAAKMRILLFHVPLHNSKSKVPDLAAKYNVDLALYGHVHVDQIDKVKSTTYVQTAAAYDGAYRVLNLDNGKIGEISNKKGGYTSFMLGTLTADYKTSVDETEYRVTVKNKSSRAFPGAAWRAEMPSAQEYVCTGCTVTATYPEGGKTLVMFTFDIAPKGETVADVKAK